MPKMSEIDDYDQCMEDKPRGEISTFCMVRVVIRPDNSSDLWHLIEDVSKDYKIHENHALLERGICMSKCERLVRSLPEAERQAQRVQKFPINFDYILDVPLLKDLPVYKELYSDMVDICVNYNLNANYGLKGYTEVESCDKSNETMQIDLLDQFCLVVIMILLMMVITSSYYDKSLNYSHDVEHYKKDLDSRRNKLLASFSILRNWHRLTYRSQSERSRELRVIQGFRFLTLFGVMWGHIYASYFYIAIQNGLEVEKQSHELLEMLEFEGTRIVQTFFLFGAFMLSVTIMENEAKIAKAPGLLVLLKGICYRYIRLTPAHALMILITATWYPKLQDGPWWKVRAENDRSLCRETWWVNLLYINNFPVRLCMDQTWYLGCDFQLFILGMLLLLAIIRFRRYTKSLLAMAMTAAVIWPAVVVYNSKQEGTYIDAVQYRRFFYAFDKSFTVTAASVPINLGNYLIGMITGMLYLHLRRKNFDLSQKKWSFVAWFLLVPICIGTLLLNAVFYWNDFPKPSLWMSIYFPLSMCSWGILNGIGLLGLIFGAVPMLTRVLNHPIFESLGRLTYSAYLCHLAVLRLILHSTRTPFHVNVTTMLTHTITIAVLSYSMALVLFLLLEQPVVAILYVMFEKTDESNESKDTNTLDHKCPDKTTGYETMYIKASQSKDFNQNVNLL
ncbi:AAEL006335-PA [Aedes aegypti]|nr:AAEL006335-PA [Aedes aegypti]